MLANPPQITHKVSFHRENAIGFISHSSQLQSSMKFVVLPYETYLAKGHKKSILGQFAKYAKILRQLS